MIMDENNTFCTRCGKFLSPEAQYCSECGAPVPGSRADTERKQMMQDYEVMLTESRRTWVMFLMIVYFVPAIVFGIYVAANAPQFTDILFQNSDFIAWADTYGFTPAAVESGLSYFGYFMTASGACVGIATACFALRRYWMVSVVMTLIGSILFCGSVFGILIGLMVAWMIYTMKDTFTNEPVRKK